MDKTKCPICDKGILRQRIVTEIFHYRGADIPIPDYKIYECNLCGEALVDKESSVRAEVALSELKKMEYDNLMNTPFDIITIMNKQS